MNAPLARMIARIIPASAALIAMLLLAPGAAQAGIASGAGPIFPALSTVGQTTTGSIELRNDNTNPNDTQTNTICNLGDPFPCPPGDPGITLIPTCGQQGAFSVCAPGGADPGVFQVHPTATGVSGTACSGMAFDVTLSDPTLGRLRFTPRGGAHVLLPGNNAFCQVAVTFDVVKLPAVDIDPVTTGVQTAQIVDNTQYFGPIIASGRGSSIPITVLKSTPKIVTTASPDITLGGQVTDTAMVGDLVNPQPAAVDFRLYGPDGVSCSRAPVFESLSKPYTAAGARVTSDAFTPTLAGTYRWRATYRGDANNEAVTGACGEASEMVRVTEDVCQRNWGCR